VRPIEWSEKDLGPLGYAVCERGYETVGNGKGEMGFCVKCLLVESSYGLKHTERVTSQLIMYQAIKKTRNQKKRSVIVCSKYRHSGYYTTKRKQRVKTTWGNCVSLGIGSDCRARQFSYIKREDRSNRSKSVKWRLFKIVVAYEVDPEGEGGKTIGQAGMDGWRGVSAAD
jgi:hypothetical protein